MRDKGRRYVSYLLRLWQMDQDGDWVWRASLQDARSGERRGFASLEALFAYLTAVAGRDPQGSTAPEAEDADPE